MKYIKSFLDHIARIANILMGYIKSFLNFLSRWIEIVTIPIGITLWYFSDEFLRFIDPTSASYDAGVFQIILFSIIQFFIYTGVIWIYIKITFPKVYKYLDDVLGENLNKNNNKMTQWEKSKIVLWLFSLFFIGIIILSRVI